MSEEVYDWAKDEVVAEKPMCPYDRARVIANLFGETDER